MSYVNSHIALKVKISLRDIQKAILMHYIYSKKSKFCSTPLVGHIEVHCSML